MTSTITSRAAEGGVGGGRVRGQGSNPAEERQSHSERHTERRE